MMSNIRTTQTFLDRIMGLSEEDPPEEQVEPLSMSQRRFLSAYARIGTVGGAARTAKVDRTAHYRWCKTSASYRYAFIQAESESRDAILETCRKVALKERNVAMLIHLSKGAFPELFSTQRHEVSGPGGGNINVSAKTVTTDQLLERIHDIVRERQEAAHTLPDRSGLLDGPEDAVDHPED